MAWFNFFTQELAIDLGTANTLIIYKDQVVVDEPSIIAIENAAGGMALSQKYSLSTDFTIHLAIDPLRTTILQSYQNVDEVLQSKMLRY
jgi:rod shape-determining protein MreB